MAAAVISPGHPASRHNHIIIVIRQSLAPSKKPAICHITGSGRLYEDFESISSVFAKWGYSAKVPLPRNIEE